MCVLGRPIINVLTKAHVQVDLEIRNFVTWCKQVDGWL